MTLDRRTPTLCMSEPVIEFDEDAEALPDAPLDLATWRRSRVCVVCSPQCRTDLIGGARLNPWPRAKPLCFDSPINGASL
jgi:hypothetical protein